MSQGLSGPRATLNEVKWRYDALDEVTVFYEHRGAPDDRASFSGADIVELGRSFMTVRRPDDEVKIPYHRIERIDRDGEKIFDRDEMGGEPGQHP